MKNYLRNVVLLMFVIVLSLIGLHYLPTIYVFGKELKQVDILADILVDTKSLSENTNPATQDSVLLSSVIDSVNLAQVPDTLFLEDTVAIKKDTIPEFTKVYKDQKDGNVVHIIDYSDSTQRGMSPYYTALDKMEEGMKDYVRIAFFGDSFVEADILTADLRNQLQKEYGGAGVGFIPITSEMRFFRKSVKHDFKGWTAYSVMQKPYNKELLGISGEYFIPTNNAYVEYSGQSKYKSLLDTCQVASIFYQIKENMTISQRVNKNRIDTLELSTLESVASHQCEGLIGKVKWNIPQDSTAVFYGGAMDGATGIILDNFGQRGSSGYSLSMIPYKTLTEFNNVRPYDLIILEYGLNVVAKNVMDYSYYKRGLTQVIKYLKSCFPNAGFLIVSVGDRGAKSEDGSFKTMPEIMSFVKTQQQIAKENKIAFWNMFEAMGGEDSMAELVQSKPAKANLDYTHINFIGGKFMANKLFSALIDGKKMYDNREVYVEE